MMGPIRLTGWVHTTTTHQTAVKGKARDPEIPSPRTSTNGRGKISYPAEDRREITSSSSFGIVPRYSI